MSFLTDTKNVIIIKYFVANGIVKLQNKFAQEVLKSHRQYDYARLAFP
jgi:hypothetical protein